MVGELASDKLIDSLVAAIEKIDPDLVVVGSESLANAGSPFFNPATSICYCLAKASLCQSLLVVKTNSAGSLFSLSEASLAGEPGPLKIAVEAGPTFGMLSWVLSRCIPGRDSFALFRRQPAARPGQGREDQDAAKKHSERLLTAFENEIHKKRFKMTRKLFISSEGGEKAQDAALKAYAQNEKCDLVVLLGPAKGSPPHVLDFLQGCKSSVIVHRQSNFELSNSGSARTQMF